MFLLVGVMYLIVYCKAIEIDEFRKIKITKQMIKVAWPDPILNFFLNYFFRNKIIVLRSFITSHTINFRNKIF